MTKRYLYIALFSVAILAVISLTSAFIHISRHRFIETTGFYFTGIEKDSLSAVSAKAYNKKKQLICNPYCLEQYRTNDNYIYENWRYDFRYYNFFDKIIVSMPLSIAEKVESVYFKTGRQVIKIDGEEFRSNWIDLVRSDSAYFSVPDNIQITGKSYISLAKCFVHTSQPPVKQLRYLTCFFTVIFLLMFCYVLRQRLLSGYCRVQNSIKKFSAKHRMLLHRIGVFILGLLLAFIVLELSLRIFGYAYNKTHIEKQESQAILTKNTIICAGDSFTESIGAESGYDYPSQLDSIINNFYFGRFTIYNFGQSGKNSTQIAGEIPKYIEKYKPKFIVIMAGGANYWNSWGFQQESWWESLRTVKLFKLIINSIKTEKNKNVFSPDEYSDRRIRFQESVEIDTVNLSEIIMAIRSHNNDSILKTTRKLIDKNVFTQQNLYHLILYGLFTQNTGLIDSIDYRVPLSSEHVKFFYDFMIATKSNGYLQLNNLNSTYKSYYYYLNGLVIGQFDNNNLDLCVKSNPYLEDAYMELLGFGESDIELPKNYIENRYSLKDTLFFYAVIFGLEKKISSFNEVHIIENSERIVSVSKINVWVKDDLNAMIADCRQNGIVPVLMCYPFLHKSSLSYPVNEVIRSVAKDNNVVLVDNETIFDTIKNNRNSYFISDGHCSNRGYELMSRNLFNVLNKNKILSAEPTKNAE